MNHSFFAHTLVAWHHDNPRPMPWLEAKDPYKIWISEIILQQTRVAQGWNYFERFVHRFPDVHSVYAGGESEVLKYWEGLGYYTRARNLYACAVELIENHGSEFPTTYEDLIKLPGIGPYTAAAIASFAFEQAVPVLDGNVFRVISRLLAIDGSPDEKEARRQVKDFIQQSIHYVTPSKFNQALMNFGALVCKPATPSCSTCPFQLTCLALKKNQVANYPWKKGTMPKKIRHFHYFIFQNENSGDIALHQRQDRDIWKNLYEFPLLESSMPTLESNALKTFLHGLSLEPSVMSATPWMYKKQLLSHQEIHFYFYHGKVKSAANRGVWIQPDAVEAFAMPVTLKKVWKQWQKLET